MIAKLLYASAILATINLANAAKLPAGLTLCSKSDPDFNGCMIKAIHSAIQLMKNGYKPLKFPSLEPLLIPEMTSDANGLMQSYKNVKINGVSTSKLEKLSFNWDTLKMQATLHTDHSETTATFRVKGNFLSFPLDASGDSKLIFDDVTQVYDIQFEIIEKNGKKYLVVKDWYVADLIPKSVRFEYDDLFPDDHQLSMTILNMMNENAVQIYKEQAPVFREAYGAIHKAIANLVLENIPMDELFLP